MKNKLLTTLLFSIISCILLYSFVLAAPNYTIMRTIIPEQTGIYEIGTSTRVWKGIYATEFYGGGGNLTGIAGGTGLDTWLISTGLMYSTTTVSTVLIGGTATTSADNVFEVIGSSLLATTTISNLTVTGTSSLPDYVPYTGATGNVNLGNFTLTAGGFTLSAGNIILGTNYEINAGDPSYGVNIFSPSSTAAFSIYGNDTANVATFNTSLLTADRIFTFPDSSGTFTLGTGLPKNLAYWSATNTIAGLVPGSNGLCLIASSTATSGFDFDTCGAGGVSSLNALTGALTLYGSSTLSIYATGTEGLVIDYTETDPLWTASSTNFANWNTAYDDRLKWDGGATGLVAATGRTSLELGDSSVLASSTWFKVANNLSEGTAATMRTNLGLGSIATFGSGDYIATSTTATSTWVLTSDGSNWDAAAPSTGVSSLNTLTGALTIWGTSNQLTVTASGTEGVILSTPQNIHTGASPTFAGLTLSGITSGFLKVDGSGVVSTSTINFTDLTGSATDAQIPDDITITDNATTGVATLSSLISVGSITTGSWLATAIANTKGGTGQDTSTWTGIPKITAGTWATSTIPDGTISIPFLNSTTTKDVDFAKQFSMTLTKIWCYSVNGSSTINIVDHGVARTNATTTLTASLVCDTDMTNIASSTAFDFSAIEANDILNASTTATVGTPDTYININYTRNSI